MYCEVHVKTTSGDSRRHYYNSTTWHLLTKCTYLINASLKRPLQSSEVGRQSGVLDPRRSSNLGQDVAAVGHLRDPLGAHERCGFDCSAPGSGQKIYQFHL